MLNSKIMYRTPQGDPPENTAPAQAITSYSPSGPSNAGTANGMFSSPIHLPFTYEQITDNREGHERPVRDKALCGSDQSHERLAYGAQDGAQQENGNRYQRDWSAVRKCPKLSGEQSPDGQPRDGIETLHE
jgi:hypothetical protein